MRLVRTGVAAVSVKVGDFAGNAGRLREVIDEAKAQGVHLLVTPELCLSGYSLEDRIWWPDIGRRSWQSLLDLAEHCTGISVFVGLPVRIEAMAWRRSATAFSMRDRVCFSISFTVAAFMCSHSLPSE